MAYRPLEKLRGRSKYQEYGTSSCRRGSKGLKGAPYSLADEGGMLRLKRKRFSGS
jgi:hypothetical protein